MVPDKQWKNTGGMGVFLITWMLIIQEQQEFHKAHVYMLASQSVP